MGLMNILLHVQLGAKERSVWKESETVYIKRLRASQDTLASSSMYLEGYTITGGFFFS
jgi:hypothetical protein